MLELSPAGYRYGYRQDTPDYRDFGVSNARLLFSGQSTSKVDLEPFCGPVLNQKDQGSCAGHFGAEARGFLSRKYESKEIDFSPAFTYYMARQMDNFVQLYNRWPKRDELIVFMRTNPALDDTGTMGRTICRVLNQFGACTRADMPYDPSDYSTPPTDAQLVKALIYKGGAYHRINTVADMKSCLASDYTFGIGFTVYESFESNKVADTGLWTPNKNKERALGGHEVEAIGCDDSVNGGSFKIRNSYGDAWGAKGNFWMRYQDAADADILQDAWMCHLGKAW